MNRAPVILGFAIAIGAFAAGVFAGRQWLAPAGDPPDGNRSERAEERREEPRVSATAQREDRRDPEDRETGPAPATVHELLDRMERGEAFGFDAAVALLDRMPSGEERLHAVERLAAAWGRRDPAGALLWLEELSGMEATVALARILREWAEVDPSGAADYLAGLPKSHRILEHVYHVAELWSHRDRSAALAWVLGQEDVVLRGHALRGIAARWAVDDPAAAGEFALTLEGGFERRAMVEQLAGRWAESDPDAALDWATGLDGSDRVRAVSSVLERVAADDPRVAAELYDLVVSELPRAGGAEDLHRRAAREVAGRWSSTEPRAAADWAVTLPDSDEIRRQAVHEVTAHWMHMDSRAASAWAAQLPAGEARDEAARVIADRTVESDPESAFAWAGSIGEKDRRNGMMHHVLERWVETDAVAARAAFDSADLDDGTRRHFGQRFFEIDPAEQPRPPVETPGS